MHFQSQETGFFKFDDIEIPYRICRSTRRWRTISLSFESEHGLRLMVPLLTSPRRIKRLLTDRTPWIRKRFLYLHRSVPLPPIDEFKDGATLLYLGQEYRLRVVDGMDGGCRLGSAMLEVPSGGDTRERVLAWYRLRAEEVLKERIRPLAERLGVSYRRLIVTNARRLWGSCTHRNDIRINWRIIMAPLPLVDCLLTHELCHIVHKNHSKRFWSLLESLIPDQRARKRQLRALEGDLLRRGRNRT
jgi:predicted metal-dependent hydrolase